MIAAGYMAKRIAPRPDWLKASGVVDLCSVSGCVSRTFCDYVRHWKHNGYWFYDSPALVKEVARAESIDLVGHDFFYYEVYEQQFDAQRGLWQPFQAQKDFKTAVEAPRHKRLLGFDVVSFNAQTSPECSPLSCNRLAESIAVNQHCLLETFEQARKLLVDGTFNNSEPGPFRILAVYACAEA
jgi:hypothetical protein